jgi:hypothetical protein
MGAIVMSRHLEDPMALRAALAGGTALALAAYLFPYLLLIAWALVRV